MHFSRVQYMERAVLRESKKKEEGYHYYILSVWLDVDTLLQEPVHPHGYFEYLKWPFY